ncbi:ankyrin repeat-containing domain protein [Amylocarpus encephaloides]|uniref:Ankyrin repeat-containing domain protein n=1 Tax=Amylocarpus encephaloides TaxID=45428 RepID=A0A9P7YLX9_9HELO|nr:ankyrin repeat-containing domain protein [Amylocarpus encephaloides]
MATMKEGHGFIASKNQYERKLKEWDFRKNLSKPEREYAILESRKRAREGKDSQIIWQGNPVPQQKLKKMDTRVSLVQHCFELAQRPPPAIRVSTPPPILIAFTAAQKRVIRTDNLPSHLFLEIANHQDGTKFASLLMNKPAIDRERISGKGASPLNITEQDDYHDSDYMFGLSREEWVPTTHFVFLPTEFIFNLFIRSGSWRSSPSFHLDPTGMVLNSIRSCCLEPKEGDLETRVRRLLSPIDQESFLECINFFICFFSNNLDARLDRDYDRRRFTSIIEHVVYQPKHVLQTLLGLRSRSIEAFLHSILRLSSQTGNIPAGRAILEADVDRNLYRGYAEILLYKALEFDYVDLARALVNEGADVNANVVVDESPVTLLSAVRSVQTLRILLEAGAHIDTPSYMYQMFLTPLHAAICRQDIQLIREFLAAGADINFDYTMRKDGNLNMLRNAIVSDNGPLIELLLDAGGEFSGTISHDRCTWCVEHYLNEAFPSELLYAISQHATEVTRILTMRKSYMAKIRAGDFPWAALRDAAVNGQLETIELLLAAGADIDASGEGCDEIYAGTSRNAWMIDDGRRSRGVRLYPNAPLVAAVEEGHVEIVRKLVEYHVDVNAITFGFHGSCPLESAIVLGHSEITGIMIEAGASASHLQLNGNRSRELLSAAKSGNKKRAKELVEVGTDLICLFDNHRDSNWDPHWDRYWDPHRDNHRDSDWDGNHFGNHWSSRERWDLRIENTLLDIYGSVVEWHSSRIGCSLFELAVDCRMYRLAGFSITQTGNVNIPLKNNLGEQIIYPLDYIFQNYLVRSTPRRSQIVSAWADLINLLVEHGALINQPQQAFLAAGKAGHLQMMKLVVQLSNATFSQESLYESLLFAIECRSRETIDYLLSIGVKVSAPANPLMPSVITQTIFNYNWLGFPETTIELVRSFIKRGADINARGPIRYGWGDNVTALQSAAHIGNPLVSHHLVSLLLQHGADVNAEGSEGTALRQAVISGAIHVVILLMENGADVNAPRSSLRQNLDALCCAALLGHLDITQLLLNAGATSYGAAIETAAKHGHFVLANMIKDWRDHGNKHSTVRVVEDDDPRF